MSKQKPDAPAPAEAPIFPLELRQQIASRKHWNERELEALCFGIPPAAYSDMSVADAEREAVRKAIREACNNGKLHAEKTGNGNARYGGQWRIERVSAIRWAIGNGAYFPEWLARHDLKEIYARQDAERRAAGRYTLAEAAAWLAQHAGEREQVILGKLERAAKEHKLKTYGPGENATREYGEGTGQSRGVKTYYEEVCWDDLNAWLDTNEQRITCPFPAPAADTGLDDTRANAAAEPARSITKQQAIAAFDGLYFTTEKKWNKALANCPQWLEHCRVMKGRRGDNSKPSTWDPVLIAVALFDKRIPITKLDAVFVRLSDWAGEWKEKSESFR